MQRRERILAVVVGLLAVGWGGNWLLERLLNEPLREREERIERLRTEISEKEEKLGHAREAGKRLARWREQSLPTDLELARSQYQSWLIELVERAGFAQPHVDSGEAIAKKDVYRRLPFTVRGRATLDELTQFLYAFYDADHLQAIQRLTINPVGGTDELDLSLSIEALVLPGADRTDQLSTARSDRLAAQPVDYTVIAERNIFGRRGSGPLDAADHTHLTAILDVDGQPQAWFTVRTSGDVLKLAQGQTLEIGALRCTVASIETPDVILNADQERWLLTLGESLRQATALPPEF